MSITFEEVMAFHPNHNEDVYKEIRDNLGQLLPFVGAGLTADVYGMWGSTLEALGSKLTNQQTIDDFNALMKKGAYLEAAQLLEEKRRSLNLAKDLAHHFSRKKLEDNWAKVQSGALWLLPDLFACPVLTTNFDEAIETVYPRRGYAPFNALDPTNAYLRSHAMRFRRTPCVFKLHGTVWDDMVDCKTLVFTRKQYEQHYESGGEVHDALRSFIDRRSLLFLGCSLGIDRTVDVLKEAAGEGAIPHYAIVESQTNDLEERIGNLADAGIRAIVYENDKHDSVRAVLQQLLEDKGITPAGDNPDGARLPSATIGSTLVGPTALDKLIHRINSRLERQRQGHPSFRLMGEGFSRELLPDGIPANGANPIPNAQRRVRLDNGDDVVSFRDFFRQSWNSGKQTHLFITGQGGVGKTVALLSFSTEKDFLSQDVPVLYITLYELAQYSEKKCDCIDEYLSRSFSVEECAAIDRLSKEPWNGGPRVILLLDGYNEISAERRHDVDLGIRAWAQREGTQLVTTSRIAGLFGVANTKWLELQRLSQEEVRTYLDDYGINRPEESDQRLWQLLETPLMLRMYAGVQTFPQDMRPSYVRMELANSAGHLVWNYLQRELWRCMEGDTWYFFKVEYAFALLLVLPYVCWCMESAHEFKVSEATLNGYVSEACKRWHHGDKPAGFGGIEKDLRQFVSRVDGRELECSQLAIIAEETGLLAWNGDGYSLVHQSLRDGLAAIHLYNVIETPYNELPKEFKRPISEYALGFLVDLTKDGKEESSHTLLDLWESNRQTHPTNAVATHNLLRIVHACRGGNLGALDWSGMDLRGMSLFAFLCGAKRALATGPQLFDGTILDIECFKPQSHRGVVQSVSFSPGGELLATGSIDGTVRIWDPYTGRQIRTLTMRRRVWVHSVCFSSDGALLASSDSSGVVLLWDLLSRKVVGKLHSRSKGAVQSVCFSPDGKFVAGASNDGKVELWKTSTRKLVDGGFEGQTGRVISVCFNTKGSLLASGSSDGTVRVWKVATGEQVGPTFEGHRGRVNSVCFGPNTLYDGNLLASGSAEREVRLWNVDAGCEVRDQPKLALHSVHSVCFSPNGETLAISSHDGAVHLWDTISASWACDPLVRSEYVAGPISYSPDGALLAVGSSDAIDIWDVATGRMVGDPLGGYRSSIESVGFSADGKILAGSSSDGVIWLWNTRTGRRACDPLCGHHGRIRSVSFSQTGSLFASGSDDGTLRIWDAQTGRCVGAPIRGGWGKIKSVCFSPDATLVASGSEDGAVRIWDPLTRQLVTEPLVGRVTGAIRAVCFSPDGALLASCSHETLQIWDVRTWHLKNVLYTSGGELLFSICFSPDADSGYVASGSDDGTLRLWDVSQDRSVRVEDQLRKNWRRARSVCFSPDGALVASGTDDGVVRLWDISSGRCVKEFEGHTGWIRSVRFSGDGAVLASSSDDGTVRLWDVREITGADDAEVDYYVGTIEPIFGIDVSGLDLTRAVMSKHDREVLRQNGAKA